LMELTALCHHVNRWCSSSLFSIQYFENISFFLFSYYGVSVPLCVCVAPLVVCSLYWFGAPYKLNVSSQLKSNAS
jgi:hypothetical protein